MTRTRIARIVLCSVLVMTLLISGCGSKSGQTSGTSAGSTSASSTAGVKPSAVRIGTLATEDSLPLWVAENIGYFATEGLSDVKIELFQSAQERDAAFASGAIDAYMGDIIAAANLEAAGSKNTIETIMLGATPAQGRFAIVVPPKSSDTGEVNTTGLTALANVPVGTSSATIQEYVLDGLMAEAGVPAAQVKKEEVKKVPVRYELLMANKLKAAALPEPFVTLAAQSGAKIVGDDTKSKKNLSQTVLVFSDKYLATPGGKAAADAVLKAWDVAVGDINKDPNHYRQTLVDKARLPQPLATTYQVNTYPTHQLPTQEEVDAVLSWMKTKGYLKGNVTYQDLIPQ